MTTTKKTNTKPCQFCFLCRKNVQLCEVRVVFEGDTLHYNVKTLEEANMLADRETGLAISSLMRYVRNACALEVGHTACLDHDCYEWKIGRMSADVYLLCYHTKKRVHTH